LSSDLLNRTDDRSLVKVDPDVAVASSRSGCRPTPTTSYGN